MIESYTFAEILNQKNDLKIQNCDIKCEKLLRYVFLWQIKVNCYYIFFTFSCKSQSTQINSLNACALLAIEKRISINRPY